LWRFESHLLAPATILGIPLKAGLHGAKSKELDLGLSSGRRQSSRLAGLGTQTAFDFLRPAAAGVLIPKCSMPLAKNFQALCWIL
jgi:hypothetical protein